MQYGIFVPSRQKWTQKSFTKRNESQYFVNLLKSTALFHGLHKFKGKYSLKFRKKNGINADCKISIIPIRLVCRPKDELNLVVCYGFGKEPMLLITNLKSDDKRLCVAVVKVYLMRWRIEEFYRFKKQQFGFEDLRVCSLNSIRKLDLLLTVAIGYRLYQRKKRGKNHCMSEKYMVKYLHRCESS